MVVVAVAGKSKKHQKKLHGLLPHLKQKQTAVLQNMQLLGLDNTDRGHSLFVCVKELFENAIDACARRDGGVHPMARAKNAGEKPPGREASA